MKICLHEYDGDSFLLILYEGETQMGYLCVNFNYIAKTWIEPKERRKGYGSLLLREAERLIFKEYNNCILDAATATMSFHNLQAFTRRTVT